MDRARRPWCTTALAPLVLVGGLLSISDCGIAAEAPKPTMDRFAAGLGELLAEPRDVAGPALSALAEKRAETLDPGDIFWPSLLDDIFARPSVAAPLTQNAARHFVMNQATYLRLTQQLPELADAIAATAAFDNQGQAGGPLDEVLRRMREPGLAAQRALLARAIDPANGRSAELVARIVAEPRVTNLISESIVALNSSDIDKGRDLALRYASARGLAIPDMALAQGLARPDAAAQKAALVRLGDRSDAELRPFAGAITNIVDHSSDVETWSLAFALALRLRPESARTFIQAHGRDAAFWQSEIGVSAFDVMTQGSNVLPIVIEESPHVLTDAILKGGGCRAAPGMLRVIAYSARGLQLAEAVVKWLAVLSQGTLPSLACNPDEIATALEAATSRALQTGSTERDIANLLERQPPLDDSRALDNPAMQVVAAALRSANRTRVALASDTQHLQQLVVERPDSADPLVAALILALPPDHPLLNLLRDTLRPGSTESLADKIRLNASMVSRVLRLTARETGWRDQDLALITAIAKDTAAAEVSRAAFDALLLTGAPSYLLNVFDEIARTPSNPDSPPSEATVRALRAFTRASHRATDPQMVYTNARVEWLLGLLPNEALRGRVVRALARRPEALFLDLTALQHMLARGLPPRNGSGGVAVCADTAILGPFADARLSLAMLGAVGTENYQGENWLPTCLRWLSPSRQGRLTAAGELLVAMGSDSPRMSQGDAASQLTTLVELWDAAKDQALVQRVRRRLADVAVSLAPRTAWGIADIAVLRGWDKRLATDFADQAWQFRLEWLKRSALAIALAIPATLALHFAFWALLLVAYPRSVRLRTHIFYNPLARKILGLGYIDILLTWIPFLRRRLFAPFRDSLVGETDRVDPTDRESNYYPKSEVAVLQRLELERSIRESERDAVAGTLTGSAGSVVTALATWRGPTFLFGPSGRGKTSYLRHVLGTNAETRFPFIYLRASDCGADIADAICARLGGLGRDKDLIMSLIHPGLFDIYIDGLNEVDRETQESIVRFIVDHREANIFVASQEIGISLPSKLATYYLLPLTRQQMIEFLDSREPTLGPSALIRGKAFKEKSATFIEDLSNEILSREQGEDREPSRRRALAASFLATLANPMDLETAAHLLSLDMEPDPFRLQEQQFRLVDTDCVSRLKRPFPIADFAHAVLLARRDGKPEIDSEQFKEYVPVLEKRKQVRRVSIPIADGKSKTEYQFRHDKIRDYYTHFALLGDDPTERFALARDDRFSGVFDYLARDLPQDAALELKDYLLSAALDRSDHRLSDRFLQHLRWRSLLDRADPPWLAEYDLPAARKALQEFGALLVTRDQTEARMRQVREIVDSARVTTRVLSAKDAQALDEAIAALLVSFGAVEVPTAGGVARMFDIPNAGRLVLLSSAGNRATSELARIGITARAAQVTGRKLVVVNPQPELDPAQRDWSEIARWARGLTIDHSSVVGTVEIHQAATKARGAADAGLFWNSLSVSPNTQPNPSVAEGAVENVK